MNHDDKADVGFNILQLLMAGAGVGFGTWFASDLGSFAWIVPPAFLAVFGCLAYALWHRIEAIISRTRVEEIDRHLASLEAIRRAL